MDLAKRHLVPHEGSRVSPKKAFKGPGPKGKKVAGRKGRKWCFSNKEVFWPTLPPTPSIDCLHSLPATLQKRSSWRG